MMIRAGPRGLGLWRGSGQERAGEEEDRRAVFAVNACGQLAEAGRQQAADLLFGVFDAVPRVAGVASVMAERSGQHQNAAGAEDAAALGQEGAGGAGGDMFDGLQAGDHIEGSGGEGQPLHLGGGGALDEAQAAPLAEGFAGDVDARDGPRIAEIGPAPARAAGDVEHILAVRVGGGEAVALMHPPLVDRALKSRIIGVCAFGQDRHSFLGRSLDPMLHFALGGDSAARQGGAQHKVSVRSGRSKNRGALCVPSSWLCRWRHCSPA